MIIPQIVHAVYKRYEIQPSSYLPTISLLVLPPVLTAILFHQNLPSLLISFLFSSATFYGALLTSIVAYRLSPVHPLYGYPGPLAARVSKLWMMRITSKGKMYEYVKSLHDQYGMYVRIGASVYKMSASALTDNFITKVLTKYPALM